MKVNNTQPMLASDVAKEIKKEVEGKEGVEFHKEHIVAHGDVLLPHQKAKKLYEFVKELCNEAPEDFIVKVVDALPVTVEAVKLIGLNKDYDVDDKIAEEIVAKVKDELASMKKIKI